MKRLNQILALLTLGSLIAFAEGVSFQDRSDMLPETVPQRAGAVAWGDVDQDGDQDLFCGGTNNANSVLLANLNGVFVDVTSAYGLNDVTNVRSARFTDYNMDGRNDLLCLTDDAHRVRLFKQTAQHRFQSVDIDQWHVDGEPVRSALWLDTDYDGALDLVLSNDHTPSSSLVILYQDGQEFNQDRAGQLPGTDDEVGSMCIIDFDQDGLQDIFYGYSAGADRSHLYRNQGNGVYADWASRVEFPVKLGNTGACWADFNNDQCLDLFAPGEGRDGGMYFFTWDNGLPRYKNVTEYLQIDRQCDWSTEAHAVDVDMNGYMDLFVMRKDNLGCSLFMNSSNNGDENWKDAADDLGIDNTRHLNTSAAWGDMDGDGDPDLAISQADGGVKLYRNTTRCLNEYYMLHLRPLNVRTEVPNCQIYFEFETCKQIAATAPWTCSRGGDGSGVTIVSTSTRKSDAGVCRVTWPNGEITEIPITALDRAKHNWIYQIEGVPDVNGEDVVLRRTSEVVTIGNSPNPFNPTTSVSFEVREATHVQLGVYDLLGREVATLVDGQMEAGLHSVQFDASNLPTGLYLARLTALGETKLHRMLLMK